MAGLSNKQKKEWAETLICKDGLSQKEAAAKVGVSVVTMNKWFKDGNWEKQKRNLLITREAQLNRFYMQMEELNSAIMSREEGQRFSNSKEADTLVKLSTAIKALETETSIAEIAEVGKRFLNYLRSYNPSQAMQVAELYDEFVKYNLNK